ncbi:MAG: NHL repeat-containing protein [Chloroflexi bacterium]|nr:NHL repeat-containing protein [Chloroflexota bacterium]MCI0786401.1 NHL repeat-containing protein [Chloroflexota bacterium]MCI0793857.1 NHL repeat-containing protein [Chloroflexota bacterium]MCI0799163.1 NHL repeat-containing protein [Chloroflexota bacterium]MCI0826057.1 NHL repeat-containing protein [Chloroflexota bacterium]
MVTEIAPITFQYSHTIGRQENRSGSGFFYPVAITRDEENLLYVVSRGSETPAFFPCKRVTVFTVDEELVREFGTKVPPEDANDSAPDGSFMWPTSIALDSKGNAYVADEWLNRISIFNKDGDCVGKWGTLGDGEGEFNHPSGLAFDANDNLYLVDSVNHRVQVFTTEGKFLSTWGRLGSGDGEFNHPWGIEIDKNGDVYVADWRNDRIQKFAPDGRFLMKFGASGQGDGELNRPTGVAVDKDGIIYVTDFKNDRLQVFEADGSFITTLLGEATLSKWGRQRVELDPIMLKGRERAQGLEEREKLFQGPIAVEVDDEGRIFVVECSRQRVQVFRKQTAIYSGGPL